MKSVTSVTTVTSGMRLSVKGATPCGRKCNQNRNPHPDEEKLHCWLQFLMKTVTRCRTFLNSLCGRGYASYGSYGFEEV